MPAKQMFKSSKSPTMKCYLSIAVLLLFGISTRCCSYSTSYSSKQLSWLTGKLIKNVKQDQYDTGSKEVHTIHRRQSDNLEIPNQCFGELNRLSCQTGLQEQAIRIALNCGLNDVDRAAAVCDKNPEGEICGFYDFNDTLLIPAQEACLTSPEPLGDSCPSMECANSLEAVRNSPAGCCVDATYNVTNSPVSNAILSYSLWSQCGVETFQQCEQTISRTPLPNVTSCMRSEYLSQLLTLQCSGEIVAILDQVEEMEQCSQIRRAFVTMCQVNSEGTNCNLVFDQSALATALSECSANQTSCPDGCRMALESFGNQQECCFNLFYNNTEVGIRENVLEEDQFFIAGYELWNQCGVETPPMTCRNLLDGSPKVGTTIATIGAALALSIAAVWY